MLEGALGARGDAGDACVGTVVEAVLSDGRLPGLGRAVDRATRAWRCADTTPTSEDLRAVAECYAWRGGDGDLERARRQLAVHAGAAEVVRCTSREEQQKVEALRAWVRGQLEEAPEPAAVGSDLGAPRSELLSASPIERRR